ncbi:MAG: 5-formyltetrahydrofolate cyclo-ligase [Alphaproteobacteria bacterium]|nr:5-formyltetrahydrofolate cyclo-ligase [Alphaproteobacteria bacterium]
MTASPAQPEDGPAGAPAADPGDVAAAKAAARKQAQAARKAAFDARGAAASMDASLRFLGALDPPKGSTVSVFLSIGSELDTQPLLAALWARGCRVALPCVTAPRTPLIFRLYQEGDALVEESFGTRAPAPEAEAVDPDILVVPLLAFDRAGYRLGYGGGFYDRTLEGLRARKSVLAVGIAFAAQELESVPREATDQPLDWIVTDQQAFRP